MRRDIEAARKLLSEAGYPDGIDLDQVDCIATPEWEVNVAQAIIEQWNESEYANAEFDRLLTEAEGLLDIDERREVMAKLETIMQDDGPIVQPLWRSVVAVMDRRVIGFKLHPTSYIFGNELALGA